MRCPGPVSYVRKCSLGAGLYVTRLTGNGLSEGGEGYEFCCMANDYRTIFPTTDLTSPHPFAHAV